jgi:hypothetical protein
VSARGLAPSLGLPASGEDAFWSPKLVPSEVCPPLMWSLELPPSAGVVDVVSELLQARNTVKIASLRVRWEHWLGPMARPPKEGDGAKAAATGPLDELAHR